MNSLLVVVGWLVVLCIITHSKKKNGVRINIRTNVKSASYEDVVQEEMWKEDEDERRMMRMRIKRWR